MKPMNLLLCLSFLGLPFMSCSDSENYTFNEYDEQEELSVIPLPQFVSYGNGVMSVNSNPTISYTSSLQEEANFLKEALTFDLGMSPSVQPASEKADIQLLIDPSMSVKAKGGYKIEIANSQIKLSAPEALGIFYGIQTIRQAIVSKEGKYTIPEATISDYPAYSWRSVMLDEGRFFKGKEAVKKLLYEMARLKVNLFHWHLTDDQGWRLEIKAYPKLIEVGSKRKCTGVDYYWNTDKFDNIPHEGHYTQEDIKEIITYAEKLHITIIPEVEILTHASAAVASYSWLGTTGKQIEVECRLGTFDEVLNISNPEVMKFIHTTLDETIDLFPGEYIHVGGDEIQGNHWKNSPDIQKLKQSLGITEDFELQIYFFNEISKYLAGKGKKMMAWGDCIGKPGQTSKMPINIASGAVLQYWTGSMANLNYLLNHGLQVIQSHNDFAYFNAWLPDAYKGDCIPEGVETSKRKQIIGIGAECWSEFDSTVDQTFNHMFPRIAAYAETGWSKPSAKDYKSFMRRLDPLYKQWDARGLYVGGTEEKK